MIAICQDCQQVKETRRVIIMQPPRAYWGDPVPAKEHEIHLCESCAISRGIEEWRTA